MRKAFILTILYLITGYCGMAQTIRYVKPVAAGTGSGNSWANASADLQAMINASAANDEVWVATGTYYPTATTDRTISFVMKAGVKIYGDFPGTGTPVFADRNLALYETILSGDIDRNDGPNFANNSGNSFHVVSNDNNGLTNTAVLDGFTITGGNANGSAAITNQRNGGGMLNVSASPKLVNIIFSFNNAGNSGGGLYNQSSSPELVNVIFSGNNAGSQGGGMANSSASPFITNAIFWDNNAGSSGGGLHNFSLTAAPTIKNSIFWGNTTGGTTVSNISGGSTTITYSDLEGGFTGTGNINQNPLFVNAADPDGADNKMGTADDGLKLLPCSPCINTGNNTGVPTTDIAGNARIVGTTADMGAFEYQGTGTRLYVNAAAPANGDGSTWANAYQDLQAALAMAGTCSSINEIWVAAGTYYPTAGTDRTISFVMRPGLSIYGDFPATGNPVFADRNLALYETILSGDIDRNDGPNFTNNSGNSYHVISNNSNGANSTALLDGFVITAGNANGSYPENAGGGILNISASPTLKNVIFLANAASVNGGAMLNVSCAPTLTNAVFSGNNAGGQGGAIANSNGSPNIMHATFWDNNAGTAGGAMFSYTLSSPTIVNSILWGNTVAGTTVSNIGGDFAGAGNCIVEGGYAPGFNIINQDPLFINSASPAGTDNKWGTADDGLTLLPCSPGVNTGNNAGVSGNDMLGNPRIFNTTTDRGAYELQSNAVSGTATRLYVDSAITVSGNGLSWASAYQDLQTALEAARLCTNITEIWVAKGTYKPTSGTDRNISFVMVPSVGIYGSFAGDETVLADRTAAVMAANPSILSGDIDGVPDVVTGTGSTLSITGNTGNSYHVVICGNGNFNTRLDGFTVSGGNANVTGTGNVNGKGGGMLSYNNSTRIVNVTFSGNNALNGGGLYNESCSAVLTNVSFLHNKAGDGGGLYDDDFDNVSPSSIFNSVTFTGNLAQFGGGCFNYYAIPTFNNCTFSGNHATGRGGGIIMLGGVILNNSLVTANTAFNGGGVYINSASFYATNSFFVGNSSTNGGALYLDYTTAAYLTNVVVAGNSANSPTGGTATGNGGGVYMGDVSNLYCKFVDFYKNTATSDGGGIYFRTAYEEEYEYCIFWGNRKGAAISNIATGAVGRTQLTNCVVEGGAGTVGYNTWLNISEYPRFVNPDNVAGNDGIYGTADDGLALGGCSPAIDNLSSGLFLNLHTDILGNTRHFNNKYDVGAYENLTSPAIALPTVYTEKTQDIATDSVFMDNGCKIMAKVTPTPGPDAVAGNVEIKEWIEPNTFNMVRRHYQITPASNASTAQGRVTLYFTPADFQAYNANGNIPLPTQNISTPLYAENIEVVKYSGTSPNGLPGGYPAQTPVILTGSALKLWWEGTYYSISFDVTGFSGFFVKSASVTLPLNLLSFDGKAVQSGNLLNWKTANEVNFSHFEIERSTDGREFIKIGTQPSNTSGHYEYLDATATAADQYYYRLKMVDRDGRFSNSKIIRINNTGKALVGEPYPNPAAGAASIDISAVANETWTFSVVDVMGRVLHTFTRNLSKGNHTIRLDNLRPGLNYIKIESPSVHEIRKLLKN